MKSARIRFFILVFLLGMLLVSVTACGKELLVSDYLDLFNDNVMIVIGDNASQMEYQVQSEQAEAIAKKLETATGNTTACVNASEVTQEDKTNYNLILIALPDSNTVLDDINEKIGTTRLTDDYPGHDHVIIEMMANPWNTNRYLLTVAASDVDGLYMGEIWLTVDKKTNEIRQKRFITDTSITIEGTVYHYPDEPAAIYIDIDNTGYRTTYIFASGNEQLREAFLELEGETVEIQGHLKCITVPPYPTVKYIDVSQYHIVK